MFDFFCELFGDIKKSAYRYQVDSGKMIVVEGIKSVLKIENNNVILKLCGGELNICGTDLKVLEIGINYIKISGKIYSVVEVKNEK